MKPVEEMTNEELVQVSLDNKVTFQDELEIDAEMGRRFTAYVQHGDLPNHDTSTDIPHRNWWEK